MPKSARTPAKRPWLVQVRNIATVRWVKEDDECRWINFKYCRTIEQAIEVVKVQVVYKDHRIIDRETGNILPRELL